MFSKELIESSLINFLKFENENFIHRFYSFVFNDLSFFLPGQRMETIVQRQGPDRLGTGWPREICCGRWEVENRGWYGDDSLSGGEVQQFSDTCSIYGKRQRLQLRSVYPAAAKIT